MWMCSTNLIMHNNARVDTHFLRATVWWRWAVQPWCRSERRAHTSCHHRLPMALARLPFILLHFRTDVPILYSSRCHKLIELSTKRSNRSFWASAHPFKLPCNVLKQNNVLLNLLQRKFLILSRYNITNFQLRWLERRYLLISKFSIGCHVS